MPTINEAGGSVSSARRCWRSQERNRFLLATPLIVRSGSILVIVLLTDNNRFSVPEQAVTALMLLVVLLFTYLLLRAAKSVQRALGVAASAC
jgi:multiple antibiotic resistance protein